MGKTWSWIKSNKWLLAGLAIGAVVLYYVYQWYQANAAANADSAAASADAAQAAALGTSSVSQYGGGSIGVGYNGGGVPVGAPSTTQGSTTNTTPGVTTAAAPVTTASEPTASPASNPTGTGLLAAGQLASPSQLPTGAGWNQGAQAGPTLGMGGTALPTASGDFTTESATEPGVFTNSQGYASQASVAAANAALVDLNIAKSYGYQATGTSALSQLNQGLLAPYSKYTTENPASTAAGQAAGNHFNA